MLKLVEEEAGRMLWHKGVAPVGLLTYPLLQAADVLTYRATHVPVGDDQTQHMELVRHLATKFNLRYRCDFFPVPEKISGACARLRSLRNPSVKMSKSDTDTKSRIELVEPPELTTAKIRKAVTDFESRVTFDPEQRPGVSNLVTLFSLISGLTVEQVLKQADGIDTLAFKGKLAELINSQLAPIRERFSQFVGDERELERLLQYGEERSRPIAVDTLKERSRSGSSSPARPQTKPKDVVLAGVNDVALGEEIFQTILQSGETFFHEIQGNRVAKTALDYTVVLPMLNPALFTGLRAPPKAILLFGATGNGKTMLARATATESLCTFFAISAADIVSKWFGEGERRVQTLFQMARNAEPAIIFIDEVDWLLSARNPNAHEATKRITSQFLIEMEGCNRRGRVLVLAATNRPQDLDPASLRCFSQRIYIDLPGHRSRSSMIKKTFALDRETKINVTEDEFRTIGKMTKRYSFSDLKHLCEEASNAPVHEAQLNNPRLVGVLPADLRAVTLDDLKAALRVVRASVKDEDVAELDNFAEKYAVLEKEENAD
uniref:tryptophan--tRNA ligase n=1 Tax=Globodera pallida TaxID=36090 RepID=A0A183CHU4_GLOPA